MEPWMQIPDMAYSQDDDLNAVINILYDTVEGLPENVNDLESLIDILVEDRKNGVSEELQRQHVLDEFLVQRENHVLGQFCVRRQNHHVSTQHDTDQSDALTNDDTVLSSSTEVSQFLPPTAANNSVVFATSPSNRTAETNQNSPPAAANVVPGASTSSRTTEVNQARPPEAVNDVVPAPSTFNRKPRFTGEAAQVKLAAKKTA